jgi:GGDEF domain-containing protein
MLKRELSLDEVFIGHIGGDDFLIIFDGLDGKYPIHSTVRQLQRQFAENVQSYYNEEDRARGYIRGKDRQGETQRYPLLTVSAAVIGVKKTKNASLEELTHHIMKLKKRAKASPDSFAADDFNRNPAMLYKHFSD